MPPLALTTLPVPPVRPGESGFDDGVAAYNVYDNDPWFSVNSRAVWMDGDWKLPRRKGGYEFNNLADDHTEQNNLIKKHPERAHTMKQVLINGSSLCAAA